MRVRFCFSDGICDNSEEFEYDHTDFEGLDESEKEKYIVDDLRDWVENQIDYYYEIIED